MAMSMAMIDPELTLTEAERVELNAIASMRGFVHLKRLALAECGRFDVQLKNLEPATPNYESALRQYHALAKAASQFWAGLLQRVEMEIETLAESQKKPKELKDLRPEDIAPDHTLDVLDGLEP
jgi:hypothetical protein